MNSGEVTHSTAGPNMGEQLVAAISQNMQDSAETNQLKPVATKSNQTIQGNDEGERDGIAPREGGRRRRARGM